MDTKPDMKSILEEGALFNSELLSYCDYSRIFFVVVFSKCISPKQVFFPQENMKKKQRFLCSQSWSYCYRNMVHNKEWSGGINTHFRQNICHLKLEKKLKAKTPTQELASARDAPPRKTDYHGEKSSTVIT